MSPVSHNAKSQTQRGGVKATLYWQLLQADRCRVGGASLVQPGLGARRVGHQLVGLEPQVDLRLGVLQRVAAVDDVPDREEEEPQSQLWHHGK